MDSRYAVSGNAGAPSTAPYRSPMSPSAPKEDRTPDLVRLGERVSALTQAVEHLGAKTNATVNRVYGAEPETAGQAGVDPTPNGHVHALDQQLDNLSRAVGYLEYNLGRLCDIG